MNIHKLSLIKFSCKIDEKTWIFIIFHYFHFGNSGKLRENPAKLCTSLHPTAPQPGAGLVPRRQLPEREGRGAVPAQAGLLPAPEGRATCSAAAHAEASTARLHCTAQEIWRGGSLLETLRITAGKSLLYPPRGNQLHVVVS